jgi:hypothetical protein
MSEAGQTRAFCSLTEIPSETAAGAWAYNAQLRLETTSGKLRLIVPEIDRLESTSFKV